MLKIGLPTALFNQDTVEDAVLKLLKLGVDCIEIVLEIPHFSANATTVTIHRELRELLKSLNIELSAHAPFYDVNLGSSYLKIREFAVERIKMSIDLCSYLGIDILTVHPGYFPAYQIPHLFREARNWFLENLKNCARHGAEQGVKISLENIQAPYFFCFRLDEMTNLAAEVDGLGLTLDIGHAYIMKVSEGSEDPEKEIAEAIRSKLKKQITHIHFHDNKGVKDDHLVPGEGKINFPPIAKAIETVSYRGQIIVEAWAPDRSEAAGVKALTETRKLFHTD